jgi:hypothetical protein
MLPPAATAPISPRPGPHTIVGFNVCSPFVTEAETVTT